MKNGASVSPRADISENGFVSTLVIEGIETDDSGDYSCEALNEAGSMSSTVQIKVRDEMRLLDNRTIVEWYYIVGPISAVIIVTFVSWFICKHRMAAKAKLSSLDEEQGYDMDDLDHEVDEWEISRDRIVLREVIGTGAFGTVWRAGLSEPDGKPGKQIVAAKCFTPTSGEEGRKALMREINLGKRLGESPQPNIIKFIGCVTRRSKLVQFFSLFIFTSISLLNITELCNQSHWTIFRL